MGLVSLTTHTFLIFKQTHIILYCLLSYNYYLLFNVPITVKKYLFTSGVNYNPIIKKALNLKIKF